MATTPSPFLKPASIERAEATPPKQPEKDSPKNGPQKNRSRLRWILIAAAVVVLAALLAAGMYFIKRHHRNGSASTGTQSKSSSSKKSVPRVAIDLPLEAFVVNLADTGGHSYARIGITLHMTEPVGLKKNASEDSATETNDLHDMIQDQIIAILNQEQSAELLAPDGKEQLKQKIKTAIAVKAPQYQVVDIYFTQFLVQP